MDKKKKRKYILSGAVPYGLFFFFLFFDWAWVICCEESAFTPDFFLGLCNRGSCRPNVFITQEDAIASFVVVTFLVYFIFIVGQLNVSRSLPNRIISRLFLSLKKEKWDARSFFFSKREGRERRKVSQMPHRIGRIEVVPIRRAPLLYDMETRQPHHLLLSSHNDLITSGHRPRARSFLEPYYGREDLRSFYRKNKDAKIWLFCVKN